MESEKVLERRLFCEVKRIGGHALKYSSLSETGYPDRLVLMPQGKAFWVELKSEGKKPRKLQVIRSKELQKLGFEVWVIDNTQQLNKFIKHLNDENRR